MLGAENDIIIFATTRSNPSRDLGFIIQPELLNVATSRQLMKLVIVGDTKEIFAEGSDTSKKIYRIKRLDNNGNLIKNNRAKHRGPGTQESIPMPKLDFFQSPERLK